MFKQVEEINFKNGYNLQEWISEEVNSRRKTTYISTKDIIV